MGQNDGVDYAIGLLDNVLHVTSNRLNQVVLSQLKSDLLEYKLKAICNLNGYGEHVNDEIA